MKDNRLAKWARLITLAIILIYVTYEAYMHQILGGGKAPSVHALCPFGGLESLYSVLFGGSLLQKIYSGTLILFGITVIVAILFRRSFCGLLCPFGALQEFFGKIGTFLFKKRPLIPEKIDKPLRFLKYLILGLTVYMAWYTGGLWMSPYDPYVAYGHITNVADSISEDPLAIIGFILLAVSLLGSIIYDRFFCKYLCPMGALYGIIGKLSFTKVVRNPNVCINCNACTKACPVNIKVATEEKITSAECINCNECVLACPKKGALEVKTGKLSIKPLYVLILVIVLFFGSVFIADQLGFMQVKPEPLKAGVTLSILEIKGYYTIEETAKATGWSLEETYKLLGIPETVPKNTKMKEISSLVPGFSFDAAKAKASQEKP